MILQKEGYTNDEKGELRNSIRTNDYLLIPPQDQKPDEQYYQIYYGLMEYPIIKCKESNLIFPCWYISKGENYSELADNDSLYPVSPGYLCIQAANYSPGKGLNSDEPKKGDIIILPICP